MLDWCIESADGQPLVTNVRELLPDRFPYDRLPSNDSVFLCLRPSTVLLLLLFYLLASKPVCQQLKTYLRTDDPSNMYMRSFVALHNLALAVFSFVVAVFSWMAVWNHGRQFGLHAIYCDTDGSLWSKADFGKWAVLFYLSKYYEFVDTWILILKGKKASFLQVYHHTGIAFIMWAAVCSQSAWLIFVVLLNSFIHTLMYMYFCAKTMAPKLHIPTAKYLTMAQIGQFLTGITCTFGIFYLGETCDSESSRFALAMLHVYGYGLVGLFFAFAKRKYKKT